MLSPALRPPVERFRGLMLRLALALAAQMAGGRVEPPVKALAGLRLQAIRERFVRLAERIAAGTYRPRPAAGAAKPAAEAPAEEIAKTPKPRPDPTPLRRPGWLAALLRAEEVPAYRGGLKSLLQEPDTAALIAAAPAAMARILRPLCWALKLTPPASLPAPARRPRPARPKPEKPPKPPRRRHEPPRPDPPGRSAVLRDMPSSAQWPPGIPYRPLRRSQKRS